MRRVLLTDLARRSDTFRKNDRALRKGIKSRRRQRQQAGGARVDWNSAQAEAAQPGGGAAKRTLWVRKKNVAPFGCA